MASHLSDPRNQRFLKATGGKVAQKEVARIAKRKVDALPDVPDIRDRMYEPALVPLPQQLKPPKGLHIMDQGVDGACTGFALAAVINLLHGEHRRRKVNVSPFMLYEMARRHDEWPGERYSGSSLRGALRGWYNNGVCLWDSWNKPDDTQLTLERAREARSFAVGAYYRLRQNLPDFHAALTEAGVIYVSAAVHDKWAKPDPRTGKIEPAEGMAGLHAFAIVGYDLEGFWIQNSWGKNWGRGGLAKWCYEDWAANVEDAWVLRLALPTPAVFGLTGKSGSGNAAKFWGKSAPKPTRSDIAGHFVHIDDGNFSPKQPYWSTREDVKESANYVACAADRYQHLLLYAHGGLNSPESAAVRIKSMMPVFKANGIYPYSVMYDTGLAETLQDLIRDHAGRMFERTAGFTDLTDGLIESALRKIGTALWDDMKQDATLPFEEGRDGQVSLQAFFGALKGRKSKEPIQIHLVGHSTGAILVGELLNALDRVAAGFQIASCCLMAPACTIKFFKDNYAPRLGAGGPGVTLKKMSIYNLKDEQELDDTVTPAYRKSLLYLVSNAFERPDKADFKSQGKREDIRGGELFAPKPILGMEKYAQAVENTPRLTIHYADGKSPITRSATHGGFDNDPFTMNDILKQQLGRGPQRPFTASDLNY